MTKEFNSLLAAQMDSLNVAWDLSFVSVWRIVGEGIGIPSFSLKIYLLLTGIYLLSVIFISFFRYRNLHSF